MTVTEAIPEPNVDHVVDQQTNDNFLQANIDATTVTVETDSGTAEAAKRDSVSTSERASQNSTGRLSAPWWLKFVEYPFIVKQPVSGVVLPEATGFAMDAAARGPLNHVGAFLGSALLMVASIAAGCENPRVCDKTLGGVKPSSLLSITSSAVGVVAALLMPFLGAVVDHTRYRKLVGASSAFVVLVATASQISINESNWLAILILECIGGFSLILHATATFAYLPDLSSDTEILSHYTAQFNVRQYIFQTLYVGLTIVVGFVLKAPNPIVGNILYTRYALALCFGMSSIFLFYSWTFLFRKRPPLSQVPEGSTLLTTGFVQIGKTAKKVVREYRSLKWFMISLLTSPEAGAGTMIAIVVTFLTVYIGMTTMEIAQSSLLLIICNAVPGSCVGKFFCSRINPLNSYRLGMLIFGFEFALAAVVLSSPERKNWTYLFAVLWGTSMGWVYPSQRVLFATLIPKGQETEMMGMFAFSGQIIGWLPVVIFSFMNENGVDMRYGLALPVVFSTFAVICTLPMSSYSDACKEVATVVDDSSSKYASTQNEDSIEHDDKV